jgi:hypothetical protein|tara:strand:+ start:6675 stop:7052 length:378 start_codon:yes stop_codon:yes gene_type:complete
MTSKQEKNDHGLLIDLVKETKINGEHLKTISKQLADISYLVNGFTSGGSSLNGYLPDASLLAYLSVIGPAIARHLDKTTGLEELLKGGVELSKRFTEEYAAYQSEQQPKDLLSSLEFLTSEGTED